MCKKLEKFNSFCEIADSLESCELCKEGGYWEKASKTCYEYLETTKVENCHEYSGLIAGLCHVCKGGLVPAQDYKSCVAIPAFVAGAIDPANYVNCDLIGRKYDMADAKTICYTCKTGFAKYDGKCIAVATGDYMGCLEGDEKNCYACNTIAGYVMRTPSGKCEMHAGILSSIALMIILLVFKV